MVVCGVANPSIAVVIPALNEPNIASALRRIDVLAPNELIVVHAGDPVTVKSLSEMPAPRGARVLQVSPGRARQMNRGAAAATSDVLLFLHADTELPAAALDDVRRVVAGGALWGFFAVRIAGRHRLLRVIERMMNLRSRVSGIATGDQAIFVRRDAFQLLGGYASLDLMEDIDLCARLKWLGRPTCLVSPVVTSARRWQARGVLRTIVLMWCLRAMFALGVSPQRLARWYR